MFIVKLKLDAYRDNVGACSVVRSVALRKLLGGVTNKPKDKSCNAHNTKFHISTRSSLNRHKSSMKGDLRKWRLAGISALFLLGCLLLLLWAEGGELRRISEVELPKLRAEAKEAAEWRVEMMRHVGGDGKDAIYLELHRQPREEENSK